RHVRVRPQAERFREHARFVARHEQQAAEYRHRASPATRSTSLPKWLLASIARCASAARSSGYTVSISGAIAPLAKCGNTSRAKAGMIAVFGSAVRGRSTEPRML